MYYCFGCQANGDAITFVREVEHLDFVDAVERLAARAGITLRYDDKSVAKDQGRKAAPQRSGRRRDRRSTTSCCSSRPTAAPRASTCAAAASTATRCASSSSVGRPTAGTALSVHLQQQKFSRNDIVDAGLAFVNKANKLQDQFRGAADVPDLRQHGRAGRLRWARARRRRPEVQELAGDVDLPEEPVALRPQLGEGRGRRTRARSSSARATPTSWRSRSPACRTRSPRAAPRSPTTTSRSSRTSPARWCSRTTPTPPARARPRSGTGGSSATTSSSRSPTCRPVVIPADVWRDDPAAAASRRSRRRRRSWSSASTALLAAADNSTRSKVGPAPARPRPAIIAEHPSELVRDQYVMQRRRRRSTSTPIACAMRSARRGERGAHGASAATPATPRTPAHAASRRPARGRSPAVRGPRARRWSRTGSTPRCSPTRSHARRSRPRRRRRLPRRARGDRRPRARPARTRRGGGARRRRRARDAARPPHGERGRTARRSACLAAMLRAGDERSSTVKVLLDALASAEGIGDWDAVAAQRDRVARVDRRRCTRSERVTEEAT